MGRPITSAPQYILNILFEPCCGSLTHLTIMDSSHRYQYQRFRCQKGRSISELSEQYETFYLFYVTQSFLCNIICYLISVFAFSLVTLSRATTNPQIIYCEKSGFIINSHELSCFFHDQQSNWTIVESILLNKFSSRPVCAASINSIIKHSPRSISVLILTISDRSVNL